MQNIILTISLLVSNRIDTIRKCMESIRPILEQLPSELIAIDTVGDQTDGSIEVVREYTDKIYPFTWCNDFSAARNEGLKRAKGEWFMFLDDDEWFENVSEIIDFFKSGEYKNYNCATYKIRDYRNKEGAYGVGNLHRMIKREENTVFLGAVHEYLSPMIAPCKELTSFIHHYGYVFETQEEHERHSERNLSLLRPMFEKNPLDMHLRAQMVQECMYLKHLEEEAVSLCEETLKLGKQYQVHPGFQWIIASYVRLADRNKDWEIVLERVGKVRKSILVSSYTNLALSIMELNAYKKLERYQYAKRAVQTLNKAYEFLKTHPEQKHSQSVFDFEVFLEPEIIAQALENAIISLHKAGDKNEAAKWAQKRRCFVKCPAVSVSVLVSNNKNTVRRCLESVKPLQKQGMAELIVVDTVGDAQSDGSLAIAKEYADKIVHFDWCDDFAAARNAGLAQAQGEWFLYLDDDEWFDSIQEIVNFFRTGEYLCYNSATYQIRNYKTADRKEYSMAMLARMVKRTTKTCFVGCVHETFNDIFLPCKRFLAFVHHFGYVYATEEEKMAHINRNKLLLQKELEKNPTDLRCRAQMAMELATYDNEAALKFCEETFQLCAEQKKDRNFQCQLVLVFRLYESLGVASKIAEESYHCLKKQYGYSETTENAISYQMVRIHLLKDSTELAHPYAAQYFETLKRLQENEELQLEQMSADFQRYQTNEAYWEMLHFGAYSACKAGVYERAWEWYQQMPWETPAFAYEQAVWFMLELFHIRPDMKRLKDIIPRIARNKTLMADTGIRNKIGDALNRIKQGKSLKDGPDYIQSDIKLSIGILVSNNIGTIKRCLDSLTPLREAVKCELILVDTKGEETDGSFEIAKPYADKIYSFKWCNDFAAARNVCIDHAEGEWFLFVDDDEWFEDTSEFVEFFNSGECNNYGTGHYNIRNYYDAQGNYTDAIVGRFIHRTPNTRFVSRVHEHYNGAYPPNKFFKTLAHHSGYYYATQEDKKKHQNRNLSLLKSQLEEEGYNPGVCAQIVQEYLAVEDTWDEGYKFYEECIPILVKNYSVQDNSCIQWILVASARYFECISAYSDFWKQTAYLRENFALSQMAELFLAGMEVNVSMGENNLELCEKRVERYLEMWDWLQSHPEDALVQNQLDFNVHYNETMYFRVVHIGAKCANLQKKYQLANKYWKRLPWNREGFEKVVYWADMQETVNGLKAMQKPVLGPEMQKLCEQLKQNIRALIAAGNIAAAKELLQGLSELVPEDEDVQSWKSML